MYLFYIQVISKNAGIALGIVLVFILLVSIILIVTLTLVHSHYSLTKHMEVLIMDLYVQYVDAIGTSVPVAMNVKAVGRKWLTVALVEN